LDKEVKRATARRDKAAAMLAAEDAALEALLKAQAELFEAVAEEHRNEVLHSRVDSASIIDTMSAEVPARDGDKQQARMRTRSDRRGGRIPSPDDVPCMDCGAKWSRGKPHHEYDHYRGYGAEHHRSIQPVCPKCHKIRGINRGMDSMNGRIRGARLESPNPGARRIREVDGSVARFAAKHGLRSTTVRSWYAAGEAARKIPRKWADMLSGEPYRIQVSAWKNGIEE
jgi:hypothetical protein